MRSADNAFLIAAPLDPATWLEANASLVTRLCHHVCVRAADADDFTSYVLVKLVDDDYAVLRKFEGRCTIASFLIVVIRRAWSDYQTHLLGKFRPSAEAERLGDTAIALEVLLRRDGRTLDEALRVLAISREEAESIAARLPERRPRPAYVELDDASQPQLAREAEDAIEDRDRVATSFAVSATLRNAIAHLPAEDQTVLRLKFLAQWSVADIARSLQEDQQRLYARLRRICRALQKELVAAGIDAARVNELIGRADVELDFGFSDPQNSAIRPSSAAERDRTNEAEVRR